MRASLQLRFPLVPHCTETEHENNVGIFGTVTSANVACVTEVGVDTAAIVQMCFVPRRRSSYAIDARVLRSTRLLSVRHLAFRFSATLARQKYSSRLVRISSDIHTPIHFAKQAAKKVPSHAARHFCAFSINRHAQ